MGTHLLKSIILITIACLSNIVTYAHDFEVNGIYYKITNNETKEVAITYRSSASDSHSNEYKDTVNIPSSVTYNGTTYSVTSIGSYAFNDCIRLTNIEIPNSVKSIGSSAFENCSGLTSVTIGNSVTSIGIRAFMRCSGLTSVTIPNSVTSIGNYIFYQCNGLKSVSIGNYVTSIGDYAFYECSRLTSVNIPNSVTSIGSSAFYNCSGLTSVTIGNSVTSIGDKTFRGCSGLKSVTIPNSVTSIGDDAFYNCSSLTSIEIPNSVKSIGFQAFYGCSGLTSVSSMNPIPPTCGSYVFYGVHTKTCKLYVPVGSKEVYSTADQWKDFMDIIDNLAGIEDVIADEDADAPVEYFNLNGVRVDNPQNGIYIKRQGKKVEKVFIK